MVVWIKSAENSNERLRHGASIPMELPCRPHPLDRFRIDGDVWRVQDVYFIPNEEGAHARVIVEVIQL